MDRIAPFADGVQGNLRASAYREGNSNGNHRSDDWRSSAEPLQWFRWAHSDLLIRVSGYPDRMWLVRGQNA